MFLQLFFSDLISNNLTAAIPTLGDGLSIRAVGKSLEDLTEPVEDFSLTTIDIGQMMFIPHRIVPSTQLNPSTITPFPAIAPQHDGQPWQSLAHQEGSFVAFK